MWLHFYLLIDFVNDDGIEKSELALLRSELV